jgi:hypothetical protein
MKYEATEAGNKRHARLKIYNKGVHLLTAGQMKKWLSMGTKHLLTPS